MDAQMALAIISAASFLAAFCVWVVRAVVRAELEPVREDVAVLKQAVFNHLAHGERPEEQLIRRGLGYERRNS